MTTSQMVEPRIVVLKLSLEEKFREAAEFLIDARETHGALPNDPPVAQVVSGLASEAAACGKYDQILEMIDDPGIRVHLHPEFVSKRETYAALVGKR